MACSPRLTAASLLLLLGAFFLSTRTHASRFGGDKSAGYSARNNFLTGETGRRTGSNQHSQSVSPNGPLLLQDVYALEKLRRFNKERMPERVVHARGAGAHGYFVSSGDHSDLTAASFLSARGTRTEVFTRFSTVIHGRHSPETMRDPRGFAVKFKTLDGNFDLLSNNLPVFFIRDHVKFPDLVHALKPDPVTNIQDPNRFFDFFAALGGMATHMLTHLYSDAGTPRGYRHIAGHGVHAYKMVNARGKVTYVKFRWTPRQGVENMTVAEAARVQGREISHATRDLYEAIRAKHFPVWELGVQMMAPGELDDFDFDPLDATKLWPDDRFPVRALGKLVLDRVPENFHLSTESSAFSPGNFLPGAIEPSEDKLLQGRLISYHETQTHRLGSANFNWLPVNRAAMPLRNYNQDGVMASEHAWSGSVNYEPSNDPHAFREDPSALLSTRRVCGNYVQQSIEKTLNFRQAGETYRAFSGCDRANLVSNLAADLRQVRNDKIRNTMCAHFYKADAAYGAAVSKQVKCSLTLVKRIAKQLKE